MVFCRFLRLCSFFFILFSFCSPHSIISVVLSSSLLFLSSSCSHCCWTSLVKLLLQVFFSSRNCLLLHFIISVSFLIFSFCLFISLHDFLSFSIYFSSSLSILKTVVSKPLSNPISRFLRNSICHFTFVPLMSQAFSWFVCFVVCHGGCCRQLVIWILWFGYSGILSFPRICYFFYVIENCFSLFI